MSGSTLNGNGGGAIYSATSSPLTISDVDFSSNGAPLGGAISTVKQIYTDMTTKPSKATAGYQGAVPAYLTAEISNYQAALARLSSSSS